MKKLLPILLLLGSSSVVYAGGMTTRHQSSLQQIQTPTITTTERVGNTYSISGTNVSTSYTYCSANCGGGENETPTNSTVSGGIGRISYNADGTSTLNNVAASQGVVCTSGCDGNSPTYSSTGNFSFATSYTQADANTSDGTNKTVTAAATGATGASVTPGTIKNGHEITLGTGFTGGTTVTGQFISEITVFN